jgi:hypothetical protein
MVQGNVFDKAYEQQLQLQAYGCDYDEFQQLCKA